ncbi:MAG: ABC-2 family transporter protein [Candidatus Dojkabacteria bacterium]|nr:ABC-2 family transporter protein [Candidatus Dojkabacteria bacterium]MDQ7020401.1 ABC-2 family transporter protein [Candidatus Dojkabacteria bacterium]
MNFALISTYRFDMLVSWFYYVTYALVMFYLWRLTASNPGEEKMLLAYFIIFYSIFKPTRTGKIANWISDGIQKGELNSFLVKPTYYPYTKIMSIFTILFIRTLVPSILIIIAAIIRPDIFAPSSGVNFIYFLISLVLSQFMWHTFMWFLGSLSFWIREIGHTLTVVDLFFDIINGALIPIYFFSNTIQNIVSYTPAYFQGAFQLQIYQGQLEQKDIYQGLIVTVIWFVIFFILAQFTFQKGLKSYDAANG